MVNSSQFIKYFLLGSALTAGVSCLPKNNGVSKFLQNLRTISQEDGGLSEDGGYGANQGFDYLSLIIPEDSDEKKPYNYTTVLVSAPEVIPNPVHNPSKLVVWIDKWKKVTEDAGFPEDAMVKGEDAVGLNTVGSDAAGLKDADLTKDAYSSNDVSQQKVVDAGVSLMAQVADSKVDGGLAIDGSLVADGAAQVLATEENSTNQTQDSKGSSLDKLLQNKPSKGNVNSPVNLVVVCDFLDTACINIGRIIIPEVASEYISQGNNVRLIFSYYFSEITSKENLSLAQTAACAHKQDRFWGMFDYFLNPKVNPRLKNVSAYLKASEINNEHIKQGLEACLNDENISREVIRNNLNLDEELSKLLEEKGVKKVPVILVNGKVMEWDKYYSNNLKLAYNVLKNLIKTSLTEYAIDLMKEKKIDGEQLKTIIAQVQNETLEQRLDFYQNNSGTVDTEDAGSEDISYREDAGVEDGAGFNEDASKGDAGLADAAGLGTIMTLSLSRDYSRNELLEDQLDQVSDTDKDVEDKKAEDGKGKIYVLLYGSPGSASLDQIDGDLTNNLNFNPAIMVAVGNRFSNGIVLEGALGYFRNNTQNHSESSSGELGNGYEVVTFTTINSEEQGVQSKLGLGYIVNDVAGIILSPGLRLGYGAETELNRNEVRNAHGETIEGLTDNNQVKHPASIHLTPTLGVGVPFRIGNFQFVPYGEVSNEAGLNGSPYLVPGTFKGSVGLGVGAYVNNNKKD